MRDYFHGTSAAAAASILSGGFRDGVGTYMVVGVRLKGVFLSDVPLSGQEGAGDEVLLRVQLPDDLDIEDYELVEEGKPYREWSVPARLLNEFGVVEPVSHPDGWPEP